MDSSIKYTLNRSFQNPPARDTLKEVLLVLQRHRVPLFLLMCHRWLVNRTEVVRGLVSQQGRERVAGCVHRTDQGAQNSTTD